MWRSSDLAAHNEVVCPKGMIVLRHVPHSLHRQNMISIALTLSTTGNLGTRPGGEHD